MAVFAELALHELATVEIARDAKLYADIAAAAAAVFSGEASIGKVVSVVGSASLGVAPHDHVSALVTEPAESELEFEADAGGAAMANIAAMQTWLWSGGGRGAWARSADGQAQWSFVADAAPVSDEIWGAATWAWVPHAAGEAHVNGVARATVAFLPEACATTLTNAGAEAEWTWLPKARLSKLVTAVGYGQARFAGLARHVSWANVGAEGSLSFYGPARMSMVVPVRGNASLQLTAAGVLDEAVAKPFAGAGELLLQARASADSVSGDRAGAALWFQAEASIGAVVSASATTRLPFQPDARPGAPIFTRLPLAHTAFTVPERGEAWVVPEETELEAV